MFQDKTLECRDCGGNFVFTVSEQDFFAAKGFENEPSRCPDCRAIRKQRSGGNSRSGFRSQPREMHDASCTACGKSTRVPFRPSSNRPVYCSDCYTRKNSRY